jgi:biopolymer transport protein ExbD
LDETGKEKDEVLVSDQIGMLRNGSNSLKLICQIDVSALASIMFVLVFTMMVAEVSARPPHGAGVDLPKVWHPVGMWRADWEDALIIGISRDGKVFFRNEMVAPNELAAKIKERLSQGSERKVYIKADAHVGYARVGTVLDEVRSSGVEKIAFLVGQRTVQAVGRP